MGETACLESRRSRVRTPLWPLRFKETECFFSAHSQRLNVVGSFRDREVACPASDHQGSNFKSCVWRAVSAQSSHHPQEVLLAQFSLYVHKRGLNPHPFHFISSFVTRAPYCFANLRGNNDHFPVKFCMST